MRIARLPEIERPRETWYCDSTDQKSQHRGLQDDGRFEDPHPVQSNGMGSQSSVSVLKRTLFSSLLNSLWTGKSEWNERHSRQSCIKVADSIMVMLSVEQCQSWRIDWTAYIGK